MTSKQDLPIVVIGAGPVGLSAAAHLSERGLPFVVLEASGGVAGSFASTAHVRLFSPWKMNIDRVAARMLEKSGWRAPDPEHLPTAHELRTHYLEPLAALLGPSLRFEHRVTSISRRGLDKVKTVGREDAPFALRLQTPEGSEELHARAVIDASGTWNTPNWLGANGLPAIGELEQAARITYGMPDILGAARARYANQRVLVVGSGHSAAGSLISLAQLTKSAPHTRLVWAVRSENLTRTFGGGADDGLPERGSLGNTLRALTESGRLDLHRSFRIEAVSLHAGSLAVSGFDQSGAHRIEGIDQIIVATGARPDLSLTRELRLRLDPWLESSELLAPLIDPNVHSCGSVPPHGHRELTHPEPGFYAVGAKSYGRAPNFLLATGYEQARSVVAALAGDLIAADDVQLVLPETGVCSTNFEADAGGCCAPAAEVTVAASSGCCPAPSATTKTKSSARCCR